MENEKKPHNTAETERTGPYRFFSFCRKLSSGHKREKSQWAHRCSTRNTTTSEESPPCMLPGLVWPQMYTGCSCAVSSLYIAAGIVFM